MYDSAIVTMCLVETTVASRAMVLSSNVQSPPLAMTYLGKKYIILFTFNRNSVDKNRTQH